MPKQDYTKEKEQLIQKYYDKAIQSYREKRISEAVYKGTTGLLGSPEEASYGERRINASSINTGSQRESENIIINYKNMKQLEEKIKRVNELAAKNKVTEEEAQKDLDELNRIAKKPEHLNRMINFLTKTGQIKD
ncbi:MAG TPA: hypothetical protein DEO33_00820 [Rikenellaceae bacterium]|nr:hypothetical protein [Rikenellaceae bacterium]